MESLSLVGISAAVVALMSLLLLYPLAEPLKLLDIPSQRKAHVGNIPLIGGLSAFLGLSVVWILTMPLNEGYGLFLLCSAVLVVVGALDDAFDISAKFRLSIQILLGAALCYGSGVYLTSFGNILNIGEIELGWLGPIATIAAIIGATNAYNMIDGIDGLAGSMSVVSLVSLAFLFSLAQGFQIEMTLAIALVMALLPYLSANLRIPPIKKKVFMGDAGSIFIGFTIVWLLVNGTYADQQAFKPVTALWICAVPLMDMVAIMLRRIAKGQSVMMADRDHLHHMFLRAGFTDKQALALITAIAMLFAFIGLVGHVYAVPEWVMFALFLAVFFSYCYAVKRSWRLIVWFRAFIAKN